MKARIPSDGLYVAGATKVCTRRRAATVLAALFPTLATLAAPANDPFNAPVSLTGISAEGTGSNVGATKEPGEPNHAGNPGGKSVWWRWTAPFTGSVVIHTTDSTLDTLLGVYRGTNVATLTLIAANDDDQFGTDLATSRVWFNAQAGTNYLIAVDGWSGDAGDIRLHIAPPPRPANDNFTNASVLPVASMGATGSNTEATKEPGEPDHASEPGGHSVWWTWIAPASGTAEITTLGSDFDTLLGVYAGNALSNLVLIAANDQDPQGGDTSRVNFPVTAGQSYHLAVDGYGGAMGAVVLQAALTAMPLQLVAPHLTSNGFNFTVVGHPAQSCRVEFTAPPLATGWTILATNALDATGQWPVLDAATNRPATRFYRAVTW